MKKHLFGGLISISLFILFISVSCDNNAAKNAEADILSFSFSPSSVLHGAAVIKGEDITVLVKRGTDLTALCPVIGISKGAVITPSSEQIRDFSRPVKYTIVSENKENSRTYTVNVSYPIENSIFHFETWKTLHNYEEPIEQSSTGNEISYWGSSNVGFRLFNLTAPASVFPLTQTAGKTGKAAALITRKGINNLLIKAPLVSGSLFSGYMDASLVALPGRALEATKFGQPINKEPIEIKGYYQYAAGSQMTDMNGKNLAGTDRGTMAAIFFETDQTLTLLDGRNLYTHANIISKQVIHPQTTPAGSFQPFSLVLEKTRQVDLDFEHKEYKLAIVFASSEQGDTFVGAVGSTLIVDEVEIVTR